jgi:glutathione peroxidase
MPRLKAALLLFPIAIAGAVLAGASMQHAPAPAAPAQAPAPAKDESKAVPSETALLDISMKRIDGSDENLTKYKGKVIVIVNVASKCGLTPQYDALQKLYDKHKDAGLVVLGFPANEFNSQEPGSNKDIAEFCSSKFNVTFPMFEKIAVKGKETHELYKRLAALPAPLGGEPKWNFTKFIVDRTGKAVARFEPKIKPDSEDMTKKIEELLSAKP